MQNVLLFLRSYRLIDVLIEMAIIWGIVYLVVRFLRGTRGAGALKGLAVLLIALSLVILILGQVSEAFARLIFIYQRFIALLAFMLIVVFQPELRQAMIRLGQARFFRDNRGARAEVIDSVSEAVEFLSKSQFGALIAIERSVKLGGLVEGGHQVDAHVSARLLESIFWPNSPLHDLGVVIRDDRIVAANVQFPLAEEGSISKRFGSRHRAAIGLTLESDCLVVIVSEETGAISIAEKGRLDRGIDRDAFRDVLAQRLETPIELTPRDDADVDEVSDDEEDADADTVAEDVNTTTPPAKPIKPGRTEAVGS